MATCVGGGAPAPRQRADDHALLVEDVEVPPLHRLNMVVTMDVDWIGWLSSQPRKLTGKLTGKAAGGG